VIGPTRPQRVCRLAECIDDDLGDAVAAATPDEICDALELLRLSIGLARDRERILALRQAYLLSMWPELDQSET
jgi:hypothetical protein